MTNTSAEAWNKADVHFHPPGQNLGQQRPAQIQASGEVQFEGGWLHFRRTDSDEIVSIPATAVDRVQWSPAS